MPRTCLQFLGYIDCPIHIKQVPESKYHIGVWHKYVSLIEVSMHIALEKMRTHGANHLIRLARLGLHNPKT